MRATRATISGCESNRKDSISYGASLIMIRKPLMVNIIIPDREYITGGLFLYPLFPFSPARWSLLILKEEIGVSNGE